MLSVSSCPKTTKMFLLVAAAAAGLLGSLAWFEVSSQHPYTRTQPAHHHQESPAVQRPELSGFAAVSREVISPHTAAPWFRLVDQSGASVTLQDLKGRTVLLSFLYTNCPEACPLLTGRYLQLQREFSGAIAKNDLALVFITTDPQRDTPSRLLDYTQSQDGKWLFLTGDEETLSPVWQQYDVYREARKAKEEVVIYHSYRTYLIDQSGDVQVKYTGVWPSETVAEDVSKLLD